jgi:hypothetical protein
MPNIDPSINTTLIPFEELIKESKLTKEKVLAIIETLPPSLKAFLTAENRP